MRHHVDAKTGQHLIVMGPIETGNPFVKLAALGVSYTLEEDDEAGGLTRWVGCVLVRQEGDAHSTELYFSYEAEFKNCPRELAIVRPILSMDFDFRVGL